MIEAKFHEEKLKLQQRHDAAVQKVRHVSCTKSYMQLQNTQLAIVIYSSCGRSILLTIDVSSLLVRGKCMQLYSDKFFLHTAERYEG